MAAQHTFRKALDEHYRRTHKLEKILSGQALLKEGDVLNSNCSFKTWLQTQDLSLVRGDSDILQLKKLHEDYTQALEALICLHNKKSINQARSFYEGEFKEQSLKLTVVLLRWINLLNQKELQYHEAL